MRLPTTLTTSMVCLVFVGVGLVPAQASSGVSSSVAGGRVVAAGSRDLPRRTLNDEVIVNAKGWLMFQGNVDPGWNDRRVQIYKRPCGDCGWTLVKKTRTDGSGRWRTRIYAPRTGYWYWKGLVPKTGGYGRSVTKIYRTYVT